MMDVDVNLSAAEADHLPFLADQIAGSAPILDSVGEALSRREQGTLEIIQRVQSMLGDEATESGGSLPLNRRDRRALSHKSWGRSLLGFFDKLTGYAVDQGIMHDDGKLDELVSRYTTSPRVRAVFVASAESLAPIYEPFAEARRDLVPQLETLVETEPGFGRRLLDFMQGDLDREATMRDVALFVVIGQNWHMQGPESVVDKAFRKSREEILHTSRGDYLQTVMREPDKWPRQVEAIKYLGAFVLPSTISLDSPPPSVAELLLGKPEAWHKDLSEGYERYNTEMISGLRTSVEVTIREKLPALGLTATSIDDLDAMWVKVSQQVPTPIPGNTLVRNQAVKGLTRRKRPKQETKPASGKKGSIEEPKTPEKVIENFKLAVARRGDIGRFEVIDDQEGKECERMIDEYVSGFTGARMLKEDLLSLIESMQDPALKAKKLRNTYIITDDMKKRPVWSIKPHSATGRPTHSNIALQTRIRYVKLDGHRVALVALEKQDGNGHNGQSHRIA